MPTIERPVLDKSTDGLHVIVWEFQVVPGALDAFVKAYGPEGDWAQLFRESPEFLRMELVRSVQHANRFYTFDHWVSRDGFEIFCAGNEKAYQALDRKLSALTVWERRIGAFPVESLAR